MLINFCTTLRRCSQLKKTLVYSTKLLFLPLLLLLLCCNRKQRQIDTWNERIAEFEEKQKSDSIKYLTFNELNNVENAAQFANQYSPKGAEKLDSIPINIVKTFTRLRTIDKVSYQKYVTLIFAKLYTEHLKCCNQSYIIAEFGGNSMDYDFNKPSMVNEFVFMSRYLDKENLPEIWTSGIIEKWLEENPKLMDYEPIGKYNQIIKTISKRIENGEYWKN